MFAQVSGTSGRWLCCPGYFSCVNIKMSFKLSLCLPCDVFCGDNRPDRVLPLARSNSNLVYRCELEMVAILPFSWVWSRSYITSAFLHPWLMLSVRPFHTWHANDSNCESQERGPGLFWTGCLGRWPGSTACSQSENYSKKAITDLRFLCRKKFSGCLYLRSKKCSARQLSAWSHTLAVKITFIEKQVNRTLLSAFVFIVNSWTEA